MATDAPITGAPARAYDFHGIELLRLDDVSCDLSILRSLIDTAIDRTANGDDDTGVSLLHAALIVFQRADDRFQRIHDDMLALRKEGC